MISRLISTLKGTRDPNSGSAYSTLKRGIPVGVVLISTLTRGSLIRAMILTSLQNDLPTKSPQPSEYASFRSSALSQGALYWGLGLGLGFGV